MQDSRHVLFSDSMPGRQSELYMGYVASGKHWPVLKQDRVTSLPSVSPDGNHAAYTSVLTHSDVVAVPLGDGPVRTVLGSSRDEEKVSASAVAPQIIYLTNRRGVQEVWLKNLADGSERPLLTPTDVESDGEPAQGFLNPVFSPDGRRVAVGVKCRVGIRLYTTFVSGGAATFVVIGVPACTAADRINDEPPLRHLRALD